MCATADIADFMCGLWPLVVTICVPSTHKLYSFFENNKEKSVLLSSTCRNPCQCLEFWWQCHSLTKIPPRFCRVQYLRLSCLYMFQSRNVCWGMGKNEGRKYLFSVFAKRYWSDIRSIVCTMNTPSSTRSSTIETVSVASSSGPRHLILSDFDSLCIWSNEMRNQLFPCANSSLSCFEILRASHDVCDLCIRFFAHHLQ